MQYWLRITPPSLIERGWIRIYRGTVRKTRVEIARESIKRQRRTPKVMAEADLRGRAIIKADQIERRNGHDDE